MVSTGVAGASGTLPLPAERMVAFGFEDVAVENAEWPVVRSRLEEANANAVTLSVGRGDWLAFPWAVAGAWESGIVARTGRDFVREALDELDGFPVTLVVDCLAPRAIARDTSIAGQTSRGRRSREFLSVSALDGGYFGAHLVVICEEAAQRYRPDRIGLTELMFDDATFGPADLAHFRRHTGLPAFPVGDDGQIDGTHRSVEQWRCEALARFAGRVSGAVEKHGVAVDMDVRMNARDPADDRADSGHDYGLLLEAVDRIAMWNYFALSGGDPGYGARVVGELRRRYGERVVMSTGLWGGQGRIVPPGEMRDSLEAVARAGGAAVSVIPSSLMGTGHWRGLRDVWAG